MKRHALLMRLNAGALSNQHFDRSMPMATQRDTRSDLSPRKVAEQLKEEGKERIERGKASAADQVDQVASALKSAGDEFGGQSAIGNYAHQFADGLGKFGRRLRDSSIEDLANDMQAAARRNPTMFMLGGLALGIVLARLVKASTTEDEAYETDEEVSSGEPSTSPEEQWAQDEAGATTASSVGLSPLNPSDTEARASGSTQQSIGD
jgi:hypothetical protein